jgi:hypothetical protein
MFPYTAEEAEWLSAQGGGHYRLLGQGDVERAAPAAPANDGRSPRDSDGIIVAV